MRSPGTELRTANSRRSYLHPFKSFSTTSLGPRRVQTSSPDCEEKPKKESRGFFSQLRRSLTLGHRSSSSPSPSPSTAAAVSGRAAAGLPPPSPPPWGKRVKSGLSKPLKIVRTSYVDCMMGLSEDPRFDGMATMHCDSHASSFQTSASRRSQNSEPSLSTAAKHGAVPSIDDQLQAALRRSKNHAHIFSSE